MRRAHATLIYIKIPILGNFLNKKKNTMSENDYDFIGFGNYNYESLYEMSKDLDRYLANYDYNTENDSKTRDHRQLCIYAVLVFLLATFLILIAVFMNGWMRLLFIAKGFSM